MNRPKKRICPSSSLSICSNKLRQCRGEYKGSKPSRMSTKPKANRRDCSNVYFRTAAALPEAPRIPLKNSELAGSNTITSLLLLKLDL